VSGLPKTLTTEFQRPYDTLKGIRGGYDGITKDRAVPKKTVDEGFPLRGFVKCGHCQARLTSGNARGRSKTYAKYWCWNKGCPKPVSVSRENLKLTGQTF
jgi:hypothetical protein